MDVPNVRAALRGTLAGCALLVLASGCGRVGFEPLARLDDGAPEPAPDADPGGDASGTPDATVGLDASQGCAMEAPPFGCLEQSFGLRFDGSQRVEIPHAPELNLGSASSTTEAWIRADAVNPATHTVLSKRDAGNIASGFMFGLLIGGGVWTQYAGAPNHFSGAPNLLDEQWHHIAAVREVLTPASGEVRLYVDGALVLTVAQGAPRETSTTSPVLIGADANTTPAFVGIIHNVRMWSVARTQAEIEASRFRRLTGDEAGLRGAWSLNEGTGQVVSDVLGTNVGTLGGSPGVDGQDPVWTAVP